MKQEMRRKMLALRKALGEEEKKLQEEKLYQKLFRHSKWKQAETIGITISVNRELNTYPVIYKAWEDNKKVAAPVVNYETKQLDFYYFGSFKECRSAAFGLIEPVSASDMFCPAEQLDLIITPGLAFDKEGYRIGYGGGFFDKLLERTDSYALSMSFDFQLMDGLPTESFDQPVHELLLPSCSENC